MVAKLHSAITTIEEMLNNAQAPNTGAPFCTGVLFLTDFRVEEGYAVTHGAEVSSNVEKSPKAKFKQDFRKSSLTVRRPPVVQSVCAPPIWGAGGSGFESRRLESSLLSKVRVAPGFSHVGIVLDEVAGRRVFLSISITPRHCIPALLHFHLVSPSSTLKTPSLKAAQISPLHSKLFPNCTLKSTSHEPAASYSSRGVIYTLSSDPTSPSASRPLDLMRTSHNPKPASCCTSTDNSDLCPSLTISPTSWTTTNCDTNLTSTERTPEKTYGGANRPSRCVAPATTPTRNADAQFMIEGRAGAPTHTFSSPEPITASSLRRDTGSLLARSPPLRLASESAAFF
ncbi:hypothetical protein PR048_005924 [Dryococelus australis]|uniref:Uncharacterized protein n=1 Tax=Dryococelus australis TaxID=614101 RepID=A0ABQ9IBQ2_9NEOP|nr:hypothetical protein PR048_005924 [Dryococelus australis]